MLEKSEVGFPLKSERRSEGPRNCEREEDPLHEMPLFCAGQFGGYWGHQVVRRRNHTVKAKGMPLVERQGHDPTLTYPRGLAAIMFV
jgi:hypothetical protein